MHSMENIKYKRGELTATRIMKTPQASNRVNLKHKSNISETVSVFIKQRCVADRFTRSYKHIDTRSSTIIFDL